MGRKIFSDFIKKHSPVIIVDEAAQLIEAETLIILQYTPITHLVLVGNERQLSATISSQVCKAANFNRSLFERLIINGFYCSMLNEQYRMHKHISAWPSSQFYAGQLIDSEFINDRENQFWHDNINFAPLKVFEITNSVEKVCPTTGSKYNEMEVIIVATLLHQFAKEFSFHEEITIGIITFYAKQKQLIEEKLLKKGRSENGKIVMHKHLSISVNTVDAFQGQERDIIILSTVRSNKYCKIGFAGSI
jgi:senataxin